MTRLTDMDPDIRRFLDIMTDDWRRFPPFTTLSLDEGRRAVEAVRARWTHGGPAMAETFERVVDTGHGDIRVRVYRTEGAGPAAPAMVYLHGGGFMLFSIDTHDRLMREYADRGGFVVIGVDYPLAPETKFPVAQHRITGLMLWLAQNGAELGVDPHRLAMAGDSAGGNLAVATCLRLRDMDRLEIVKAILSNYGGFTGRISDESEATHGGPGAILNREEAEGFWRNYLNGPHELDDPYACPLYADLTGLPPTLLIVAELDLVAEDSLKIFPQFQAAGVDVRCEIYKGATHSFLEAMSISALACDAIAEGADFIGRQLALHDRGR
ncbi:alpha/beta hydrolase fold domain-containing protein [Brevundimonas sp.]|uniref:alpha/beta hydrolase fold domain-containing protein n=1 Tax=Brevundimonas sp. TaxID=1871086 RepID=UPI003BA8E4E5